MSTEQWYCIGQARLYQITFDIVKLFGVYFVREHYKQYRAFSKIEIKREWIEVHNESTIGLILRTQFEQPDTVTDLLNGMKLSDAINKPFEAAS